MDFLKNQYELTDSNAFDVFQNSHHYSDGLIAGVGSLFQLNPGGFLLSRLWQCLDVPCSEPDEVSWAPPVHFHPDRKPDIPTRISDSLLAEVDFVGHKTMFSRPGFFKPLSPGLEEVAGNGIH